MNSIATTSQNSRVLPLLADPGRYVACPLDFVQHPDRLPYWLDLFRNHFPTLLDEALREAASRNLDMADARMRAEQCRQQFEVYLDRIAADPRAFEHPDILMICIEREALLRKAGFDDPYRLTKERENESALQVLPQLLQEIDAATGDTRETLLVQGMFAGNIFDLGATRTQALFQQGHVDFHAVRRKLKPRPWLIDDLDLWLTRRRSTNHQQALIFVDNAGCDIVLGMIPFARQLLQNGTRVLLAANSTPTLNDVTWAELVTLIQRVSEIDPVMKRALADATLEILPDGNGYPLIDMTQLDPAFVQQVTKRNVDLLVIEGMGRAIESNLDSPFTVDTIKVAMVKDQGVAQMLKGELYDLVFRFEPAG